MFSLSEVTRRFPLAAAMLGWDFVFEIFSQSSQIFSHERIWQKSKLEQLRSAKKGYSCTTQTVTYNCSAFGRTGSPRLMRIWLQ